MDHQPLLPRRHPAPAVNHKTALAVQSLDKVAPAGMVTPMSAATNALSPSAGSSVVGSLQHRLARQFTVQVADWQDTCRGMAAWEDALLVDAPAPGRLAEHGSILDELERVGQWLAQASGQQGFAETATTEQIQLTLQDLCDSRAMRHGQTSEPRRRELLRDCFSEP